MFAQTGIALFADRMPIDLVSQFFLEQMVGLGYMATSLTLNVLAVSSPHIYVPYKIDVRLSSHQKWRSHMQLAGHEIYLDSLSSFKQICPISSLRRAKSNCSTPQKSHEPEVMASMLHKLSSAL